MSTFIETGVDVTVALQRSGGTDHILITAQSKTGTGESIRLVKELDVTSLVNNTQRSEVTDLLNAAEAYMKSVWGIA